MSYVSSIYSYFIWSIPSYFLHLIVLRFYKNFAHHLYLELLIVHTPSINNVAGNIATAACFLHHLFLTTPFNGVGPFITNFSN